jgi:hypothetical protein
MSLYRNPGPAVRKKKDEPINWRRGLFRVWVLFSGAWIMGWTIQLTMFAIRNGVKTTNDVLVIAILLLGPPVALLVFGISAGWAFRGFKADATAAAKDERAVSPGRSVGLDEAAIVTRFEPRQTSSE